MTLDATARARVLAQAMRDLPAALQPWSGLTKTDLSAAVGGIDDWVEANQASFNTGIPQPARGALTAAQKTFLLCFVAMRRAGLLRTEED